MKKHNAKYDTVLLKIKYASITTFKQYLKTEMLQLSYARN